VQEAEEKYKESKNLEEYVDFWENVWLGGGLLFYGSKWWFVLPDLYFKQKRFDEVIEFCTMVKFLDDYASDKADKYILRAQQRKEKQLAKSIKTNV
jgi:SOS response regulatory protein OraA/RecX